MLSFAGQFPYVVSKHWAVSSMLSVLSEPCSCWAVTDYNNAPLWRHSSCTVHWAWTTCWTPPYAMETNFNLHTTVVVIMASL